MRDEFSTLDIVKALGIERERLREWMNRSFVKPTISAQGQGTKALFSRRDVYRVELFRQLLEEGFDRDQGRIFVDLYRQQMGTGKGNPSCLIIRLGTMKFGGNDLGPVHSAFFAFPGDKLLLDEGYVDNDPLYGTARTEKDKWYFMHVVNLRELRSKIDQALGNL